MNKKTSCFQNNNIYKIENEIIIRIASDFPIFEVPDDSQTGSAEKK